MSKHRPSQMLVVAPAALVLAAATAGALYLSGTAGGPAAGRPVATTAAKTASATIATCPAPSSADDAALRAAKLARASAASPSRAGQGGGGVLADPRATAVVAEQLAVDRAAAARALTDLTTLAGQQGGLDPDGSGFAAVADRLGVSPDQLAAAIDALKRTLR